MLNQHSPLRLELSHIAKRFGEKSVLTDATFAFERGKIYGLLGRNGAGKTTLFNCLAGELQADSGTAMLVRDGATAALTQEEIGYVFSTPVLPEFLTGYEFVKFYMDVQGHEPAEPGRIHAYFDLIKIDREDRDRLIKGYSHGMKNKLQMLCFLIARPPVILLDEPLTSFDVVVALEIKQLLRELKQNHIIIFSTHILQLAEDLCDEIVVLSGGSLQAVPESALHSEEFEAVVLKLLRDEEQTHPPAGVNRPESGQDRAAGDTEREKQRRMDKEKNLPEEEMTPEEEPQ